MSNLKNEQTCENFESKIEKLQEVVDKLESDISLDESLRLFESGIALTKQCIDELNSTQARIDGLKTQLDIIMNQSDFGDDNE